MPPKRPRTRKETPEVKDKGGPVGRSAKLGKPASKAAFKTFWCYIHAHEAEVHQPKSEQKKQKPSVAKTAKGAAASQAPRTSSAKHSRRALLNQSTHDALLQPKHPRRGASTKHTHDALASAKHPRRAAEPERSR